MSNTSSELFDFVLLTPNSTHALMDRHNKLNRAYYGISGIMMVLVWLLIIIRHSSFSAFRLSATRLRLFVRKRYGHGGRVHEIKITDTAEITTAGTNPNPEP